MNKDKKLAIFLAPFLIIGGYVASDQYIEHKNNEPKMFQLSPQGECALFTGDCILESGDLQINITDDDGITKINTSFPVDKVAISLVNKENKEIIYGLDKNKDPQYWQRETDIRAAKDNGSADKLRVFIKRKGSTYLSEFIPKTMEANN
jgi:hypothetical protein